MAIFLHLLAMVAVFVCTWMLLFHSDLYSRYNRFVRHALGLAAGGTAFMLGALLIAWEVGWLLDVLAAGMVLAAYRQKRRTPEAAQTAQASEPIGDVFQMPAAPSRRSLNEWTDDTTPIWSGLPRCITFSYEDSEGRSSRRSVDVDEISEDQDGTIYFSGFCHRRNDRRTFRADRITSQVTENSQRWEPYQWLSEVTGHDL